MWEWIFGIIDEQNREAKGVKASTPEPSLESPGLLESVGAPGSSEANNSLEAQGSVEAIRSLETISSPSEATESGIDDPIESDLLKRAISFIEDDDLKELEFVGMISQAMEGVTEAMRAPRRTGSQVWRSRELSGLDSHLAQLLDANRWTGKSSAAVRIRAWM